jgi:HEAT repeat protein
MGGDTDDRGPIMRRTLAVALILSLSATCRADEPPRAEAWDEQVLQAAGVPTDGPGLLAYFRARTLSKADQEAINGLVRQLGDKSFRNREKAAAELTRRGTPALPALRRALTAGDAEIVRQARQCIEKIERGPGATVPAAAARLIRLRKPAGAAAVLLAYLPVADDAAVEEEVLDTLVALTPKGTVDRAVVEALTDAATHTRSAAALVVGRAGTPEERAAVRRLLADREPTVRLRAAQGLAAGGDKTAVPVLIALLEAAPPEVAALAEDLLGRLAGEQAPASALGGDAAARRKCHAAWDAWWKASEAKTDLAKIGPALATASTAARDRQVVRQFLDAFTKADTDLFTRTTAVPFLLGSEEVKTRDGLNGLMREIRQEIKDGRITFTVKEVVGVEDHLAVLAADRRDPVWKLRRPGVRVVYVDLVVKDSPPERSAIFVQTAGGRPRVIGIGEAKAPPKTGK